ncbi:hypothetical protein STRDD11_01640 [Streptococcus sp. DD11]|nr:hypothetical protein STRDD11_01640 [Streptococcus sp. DD11]
MISFAGFLNAQMMRMPFRSRHSGGTEALLENFGAWLQARSKKIPRVFLLPAQFTAKSELKNYKIFSMNLLNKKINFRFKFTGIFKTYGILL